ncbi:hypothetical protein KIW84_073123 [Lathyrus oleraceus]|uniref:CCHC-type domain-containing protein n=1 Tax=Pisum sativum TaxID=3888 RepID=A0A9D4ZV65_PEA|nr:hypothetical protein KIW84_073123 [Pisum sativum]
MDNKKWEEQDLRVSSIIHTSLAKNILANVLGTSSGKERWEKLEGLYQGNERRLKDEENTSSNSMLVARGRSYVKKNNETGVRCWKCGKLGHIKYKCPYGAASEKAFESNASNISLVVREGDLL